MADRTDESFEAEEIVALRLQLFRTRSKVEQYDKIAQRVEFYQQVLSKLIDVLSDRNTSIQQVAAHLGIKISSQEIDLADVKMMKGGKENERAIFGKLERLNLQLDAQEDLLAKINQTVAEMVRSSKEKIFKLEEITKEHSHCGQIGSIATQHLEKLRQIEEAIQQKDASIAKLQKINEALQQQINSTVKQKEESASQLRIAQKEQIDRGREAQENREIAESAQEAVKEKKRILDNCEKLMEIITIPQEDYLKYYFRSNGLPLEPQRPQKNKYSIVFDN